MSYRLVPISLLLILCQPAFAGTSICNGKHCLLIGTPPAHIGVDADGAIRAEYSRSELSVGGTVVAGFFAEDAKIVFGDWDGDGFDEPGAYVNGTWILQMGWDVATLQRLVHMTALNPGPDAVPLVGSWQGSSVDGIGVYDNGVFTLYDDYNDLSQATVIDFGNVANNTGTVWESMPFVGPIDEVMDRVGLSKNVTVAYAPHNNDATYDFSAFDKALVIGTVPFRGFVGAGFARPYVLDAATLPDLHLSGHVLSFRFLPGMEPESGQCVPTGGYDCFDGSIAKPADAGDVVVPIENPFR